MRAAKSLYQGIPCHYVVHSAIEYVFVDEDNAHLVLAPDQAQARQAQISVLADYFDDSLAEMEGAEKALSDKDYFEFMRQFQLSWQKELESFRIPMGAFAQHQCDYSKVAAAFDRKFFGKNLSLTHENSSLNP